jgi:transcriptional regulator with GAF, ATPase, and Fis domain
MRHDIDRVARVMATVLICGETGVGKEVVARLIHLKSARSHRPFVAMNFSGIPEPLLASELFGHVRGGFPGAYRDKAGLARQADGGTLFLDELAEISLSMQAAVLRFAERGEIQPVGADRPAGRVDVRLISATNRDLRARIGKGAFREDLYYRLNIVQFVVPPLRERADDIPLLSRYYLSRAAETHRLPIPQLTTAAEDLMRGYDWPENVRELKHVTERLVVRSGGRAIEPDDLPEDMLTRGTGFSSHRPRGMHATPNRPIGSRAAPPFGDDGLPY